MNHEDLFHTILNDTGESHSMMSLKQLSLAIAIVSLLPITDKRDDAWEILSEEQRSWRTFMNRIHRLMLSLLNKYSITACRKVSYFSYWAWIFFSLYYFAANQIFFRLSWTKSKWSPEQELYWTILNDWIVYLSIYFCFYIYLFIADTKPLLYNFQHF